MVRRFARVNQTRTAKARRCPSPFRVAGETGIQAAAEDEGEIIQGNVDILVLQHQIWVAAIESKNSELVLTEAIL